MAKVNTIPIINKYDVPYLGGYSQDGTKVYIDRHLDTNMNGKDISRFIRIHEVAEKALIDLFDLDYQTAHHIALHIEHQAVKASNIDWNRYSRFLNPYIKKVSNDLQRIPPDLDITPYKDENDRTKLKALLPKIKQRSNAKKVVGINEVKLSLQYHTRLNEKLWDDFKLKQDVKQRLLQIGYMWADFAKIPRNIILDVIMTGGNANYNYTDKSDIDVHLIIDRSALGIPKQFLDEYLQDKKTLWSVQYNIKIYGYAIELYAQDASDRYPQNQGVYSLLRDEWVQMPKHLGVDFAKDPFLKKKVMGFIHQIDTMIKNKFDLEAFKNIRSKLRDMRNAAIQKGGEFSQENLVFKELRNRGYLDKINRYMKKLRDEQLSLK
jgi:hypothetical protein